MELRTCASIYTGGRGADRGLEAAGLVSLWGCENDPAIAEVARANGGDRLYVRDATAMDWRRAERPDLLWVSPECKEFSNAKTAGAEGPVQRAQAEAVCAALEALTPAAFILENVYAYRASASFARIRATLDRLGYWSVAQHVNCADFGVPQTRRRLILRAVRGGLVPPLPRAVPWVGWYAAIADLLPTLPESAFAPWQLARLPAVLAESTLFAANDSRNHRNESYGRATGRAASAPALTIHRTSPGWWKAFLVGGGNTQLAKVESKARGADDPAFTVFAGNGSGANMRAWVVDCQSNKGLAGLTIREAGQPMFTICAGENKPARAWLDEGRVVAFTARALARLQTFDDGYVLPDSKTLAATVIGNAVPSLLAQRLAEGLLR